MICAPVSSPPSTHPLAPPDTILISHRQSRRSGTAAGSPRIPKRGNLLSTAGVLPPPAIQSSSSTASEVTEGMSLLCRVTRPTWVRLDAAIGCGLSGGPSGRTGRSPGRRTRGRVSAAISILLRTRLRCGGAGYDIHGFAWNDGTDLHTIQLL